MGWQSEIQKLIRTELSRRKDANGEYSLRKMAKEIGVPPATLSRCTDERFNIALETAERLIHGLNLSKEKRDHYLAIVGLPIEREETPLPLDGRFFLEDWLYIAVWACFDLSPEARSTSAIARRLAVSESAAQAAIDTLVEKKFLVPSAGGFLEQTKAHWMVGNGPADPLITSFHQENLRVQGLGLSHISPADRQFSAFTFTGSQEQFERARKEMIEFCRKITALMEDGGEKSELYRFSISLFPLNFENKPV